MRHLTSLLMLALASQGFGQTTGAVSGEVRAGSGPLSGVIVSLSSAELSAPRSMTTGEQGDYAFEGLTPGAYAVIYELTGYKMLGTSLRLGAGETARIDVRLPAAEGAEEVGLVGTTTLATGVVPPRLLTDVRPSYPAAARAAKRQGVVRVEATIDEQGEVVDARVLSDEPGFGCAQAALAAVSKRKYEPATVDGKPVKVATTVVVTFR